MNASSGRVPKGRELMSEPASHAVSKAQPETEGALPHKQIMLVIYGLMLGMLLAALDMTIMATATKTIADQLHGQTIQAWVTTAYLITSTIATPLYGKLSDIYGRKPMYMTAIGLFLAGSSSFAGIAGWRWVFLVNIPIGIIGLIVVFRYLNVPHRKVDHRIDYWGAGALTAGLVPLLIVAEQGREWGWGSGAALTMYVNGALGLAAVVFVESRIGDEALIPF